MKKTVLILFLAVVLSSVFLLGGCTTSYKKNILKTGENGTFEYENLKEMQTEWNLKTDSTHAAADAFDVVDYAMVINTTSTGWAQAMQEVEVLPNAYYMVEYTYTCSTFTQFSTSKGAEFFFISFLEDEDFNTDEAGDKRVFHNTATVNEKIGSFYFKTKNAVKATLAINVGTEKHPVSVSNVTIKSIKLIRVTASEAKNGSLSLFTFESDTYGEVGKLNILYIVLGGVGVLILGYAAYFMFQRNLFLETENYKNKFLIKLRDSKWLGIVLTAGIALFIRLIFNLVITLIAGSKLHYNLGYEVEGAAAQALFMGKYGTAYLTESLLRFTTDFGYVYKPIENAPLYLYTLSLCGVIGKSFGDNAFLATTFLIKFVSSLADIGTIILIYLLMKKHIGGVGAAIMSIMYSLLPVTFGISSIWGLNESLLAFSMMLTFYFMLQNNYYGVAASYMAAFLTSWIAIIILPIIVFYTIMQFINRKELRIPIGIAVFAGFVLFYLFNLPFTINSIAKKPFLCFTNYWNILWKNVKYTLNAFNFQSLLGNNFTELSIESLIVSIVFILFIFTIVAVGYFKNKNRMDLFLMASMVINMIWMFGNNMSPASLYFSLALMLAYAIMNKEKRIYFSFVMYAALMFVNVSYAQLLTGYSLTAAPQINNKEAAVYVFSALYLILTLYYVYIIYDIVAVKKARRIQPMPLTYIGWWKNLFLRIKKSYYKMRIKQVKQG